MLIFFNMLKIRLKRVGRKNDPSYRVVVVPSTVGPKSGNVLEVVGNYDPRRNIKEVKGDRIKFWMDQGAQTSDTVHNILVDTKVIEAKKINALPKKKAIAKEVVEEKEEVKAEAESVKPEVAPEETTAEETPSEEAPAPIEEPKEEAQAPETEGEATG
jgi:small subunit ribosomal protein S16